MSDEKIAEEWVKQEYPTLQITAVAQRYIKAFLAGLKVGRPKWHNLQKDPNDLPTSKIDLDMCSNFIDSKIKVVAKIFFKGYKNSTPWEDILYYEDGKWLELHHMQGKCKFFKEIPKCEYVLEWCEIPQYEEE